MTVRRELMGMSRQASLFQNGASVALHGPKQKPARKRKSARTPKEQPSLKPGAATVYEGRCNWVYDDIEELIGWSDGISSSAIFRKNEIVFDWITDGGEPVSSTYLSTDDGTVFRGYTRYVPGWGDDVAQVEALLYSNSQDHILLGRSTWQQEASVDSFIVQFHSGKRLADSSDDESEKVTDD
jgi:hypothetical protein